MESQSGDVVQRSMNFDRDRVDQIIAEAEQEMAAQKTAQVSVEEKPVVEVLSVAEARVPEVAVSFVADPKPVEVANPSVFSGVMILVFVCIPAAWLLDCAEWAAWKRFIPAAPKWIWLTSCFLNGCLAGWFTKPVAKFMQRFMAVSIHAITNTAIGVWTAVKSTVMGIGTGIKWVGIGLYYAVTNQLMLSGLVRNIVFMTKNGCTLDQGPLPLFPGMAHIAGIAVSIGAVYNNWGTPLTDKLIFCWWGFYVLNIFYLIGTKVRESKKAS